jgi:hypothetical protein
MHSPRDGRTGLPSAALCRGVNGAPSGMCLLPPRCSLRALSCGGVAPSSCGQFCSRSPSCNRQDGRDPLNWRRHEGNQKPKEKSLGKARFSHRARHYSNAQAVTAGHRQPSGGASNGVPLVPVTLEPAPSSHIWWHSKSGPVLCGDALHRGWTYRRAACSAV